MPHATRRQHTPLAACRPSSAARRLPLVTLCPPPASRAHHLDEPNSTDRACPVTALAPLPRPLPRYRCCTPRFGPRRTPCIAPRRTAPRHATASEDHAAYRAGSCHASTDNEPSPTLIPLHYHHLSSATRRNFLRHGVILVYIQSHAHDLLPLPLPSPPFRSQRATVSYQARAKWTNEI